MGALMSKDTKPEMRVVASRQLLGREQAIYSHRFSAAQERARQQTWSVLVPQFFQRYVKPTDVVVDLGAGDGLFITRIVASMRIAVDISPHAEALKERGVLVYRIPATELSRHLPEKADVIFMSNFLEHLPDKRTLLEVLEECRKSLRPGGRLLVLQPNIRYVGAAYWDYIDHHIALTEESLREALEISGFRITRMIPRFLPYTAKSKLSALSGLVGLYLKLPFLWRIFGKQTFVVAELAR